MKYFKFFALILFITFFSIIENIYADSPYNNFAYISWTAYLNFQWEIEWKNYNVYLNTTKINYITWNDGIVYQCFSINGTWYTDTIWEVYFWYWAYSAYSCADWILRGYVKLSAWWRILLDDKDLSNWENWKVRVNYNWDSVDVDANWKPFHYHSKDWEWNWQALSYTNWLWLWNWNTAKILLPSSSYILAFVGRDNSQVNLSSWIVANWVTTSNFSIQLVDIFWKNINWLKVWKIWFDPSLWSYFRRKNPDTNLLQSTIFFENWENFKNSVVMNNSNFSSKAVSLMFWTWSYTVQVSWADWTDMKVFLTWSVSFSNSFNNNLSLIDWNWDWKILIWYSEIWSVKLWTFPWVQDLEYNWKLSLISDYPYTVVQWTDFVWSANFPINIKPLSDSLDSKITVSYLITGKYNFKFPTSLKFYNDIPFEFNTKENFIYADKKVDKLDLTFEECMNKLWNWKDICKIKLIALSKINLPVPHIEYNMIIEDLNINSPDRYSSFDLDELWPSYINWLVYSNSSNITDSKWAINISLRAYKPVFWWKVKITLNNIKNNIASDYNWISDNSSWISTETNAEINFNKVVDILFSWLWFENWVALNENNEVYLIYKILDATSAITNPSYKLVWSILGCADCSFVKWWEFSSSNFWTKLETITLTWSIDPDSLQYYNDFYKYTVSWINWEKEVTLVPNIKINWKKLSVIWQFYWLKLFWLANKSFNFSALTDVAVIWSNIPFSNYISDIEKQIFNKNRWKHLEVIKDEYKFDTIENLWSRIYQCESWWYISIKSVWNIVVKWTNDLVFRNCRIHIKSDILSLDSTSKLTITSIWNNDFNVSKNEWWRTDSVVYIYPNINTIVASIVTNWTILLPSEDSVDEDKIFVSKRWDNTNLKRQLYIKWKIMARNTLGWGFLSDDMYVLPWWRKVDKSALLFDQNTIPSENYAQAFDMQFWRATYVKNGVYDLNLVSPFIKDRYSCTWSSSDDKICLKPIVLENDR